MQRESVSFSNSNQDVAMDIVSKVWKNAGRDSAYSWIVAICAALVGFFCWGSFRSFGVLYAEVIPKYDLSRKDASWPFTLQTSVACFSSILPGFLLKFFSSRQLILFGTILMVFGLLMNAIFSTSLAWLNFYFGIVFGAGVGNTLPSTLVIANEYFGRNRGVVNGLILVGDSLSTFLFPPLIMIFIEKYSLHGTFLMLGGMYLNLLVCGMLMRPLPKQKVSLLEPRDNRQPMNETTLSVENNHEPMKFVLVKNKHEVVVPFLSQDNSCSSKSEVTEIATKLIDPDIEKNQKVSSGSGKNTFNDDNNAEHLAHNSARNFETANQRIYDNNGPRLKHETSRCACNLQIANREQQILRLDDKPSKRSLRNSISKDCINTSATENSTEGCTNQPLLQPMHEHICTPKCMCVEQSKSSSNSATNCSNDTTERTKKSNSINTKIKLISLSVISTFHEIASINKNPVFLMIALATVQIVIVTHCYCLVLVDFGLDAGVEKESAAMLVTVFGVTDLVSKLSFGWIADRGYVTLPHLIMISEIISGIVLFLHTFVSSPFLHFVLSAVHGLFSGSIRLLTNTMFLEVLGRARFPLALSLKNFYIAFLVLLRPFMIGFFRDNYGSYTEMFYFFGAFTIFCGLVFILEPRARKWMEEKN